MPWISCEYYVNPITRQGSFLVTNCYPDNGLHKKDNKYRQLKMILRWTVGKGGRTKHLSWTYEAGQNIKEYF